MKLSLAVATTSTLATSGAGFSGQRSPAFGHNHALTRIMPQRSQPISLLSASTPSIRTTQMQNRVPLTRLMALPEDCEPESVNSPSEEEKTAPSKTTKKESNTADVIDAEVIESKESTWGSYLMLDELKALGEKYRDLLLQDASDLKDSQVNRLLEAVSEKLEEADERNSNIIDGANQIIDYAEELCEWVDSTRAFAKNSMPDFLKPESTKADTSETTSKETKSEGCLEDQIDQLKTRINKFSTERIPNTVHAVESIINRILDTNVTLSEGEQKDGDSTKKP